MYRATVIIPPEKISPIVVDLDGDGLELVGIGSSNIWFDIDQDGADERVSWVEGDDGILFHDADSDGRVTDAGELFGPTTNDGFAELAVLDSNLDGVISEADTAFGAIGIWQDLNQNGVSDDGEITFLPDSALQSISLSYTEPSTFQNGIEIAQLGSAVSTSGETMVVADVIFERDDTDSYQTITEADASPLGLSLPSLREYGNLEALPVALTNNEILLGLMGNIVQARVDPSVDIYGTVEELIFEWAGVASVDPTSRGSWIDARKLEFLEEFFDVPFNPAGWGPDPGPNQAQSLQEGWDIYFEQAFARLMVQGPLADVFEGVSFDFLTDSFVGNPDFAQSIKTAANVAPMLSERRSLPRCRALRCLTLPRVRRPVLCRCLTSVTPPRARHLTIKSPQGLAYQLRCGSRAGGPASNSNVVEQP